MVDLRCFEADRDRFPAHVQFHPLAVDISKLENGFDELHGVDWKKGCYVGQELTARTKYRGLIKKRLTPVRFEGEAPSPGTLLHQNGQEVGEMRSGVDGIGVALLRLEALGKDLPVTAGNTLLSPQVPGWVATSV